MVGVVEVAVEVVVGVVEVVVGVVGVVSFPAAARPVAGTSVGVAAAGVAALRRAAPPAGATCKPIAPAGRKTARPRANNGRKTARPRANNGRKTARPRANNGRKTARPRPNNGRRVARVRPKTCRATGRTGPMITMVTAMVAAMVTAAPMRPGLSLCWRGGHWGDAHGCRVQFDGGPPNPCGGGWRHLLSIRFDLVPTSISRGSGDLCGGESTPIGDYDHRAVALLSRYAEGTRVAAWPEVVRGGALSDASTRKGKDSAIIVAG